MVAETEASKQGFEDGPPITLSPLARGDEKFFEPGTPQRFIYTERKANAKANVFL